MEVPGVAPPEGSGLFAANWNVVDIGYFETLRLAIVSRRAVRINAMEALRSE
jgi:hypothetical protein